MRRAEGYLYFCNTKIIIFIHICKYISVKYVLYVLTYTLNIVNDFFFNFVAGASRQPPAKWLGHFLSATALNISTI